MTQVALPIDTRPKMPNIELILRKERFSAYPKLWLASGAFAASYWQQPARQFGNFIYNRGYSGNFYRDKPCLLSVSHASALIFEVYVRPEWMNSNLPNVRFMGTENTWMKLMMGEATSLIIKGDPSRELTKKCLNFLAEQIDCFRRGDRGV